MVQTIHDRNHGLNQGANTSHRHRHPNEGWQRMSAAAAAAEGGGGGGGGGGDCGGRREPPPIAATINRIDHLGMS